MSNIHNPPVPEHRVRKRRRRTVACVQCRSRKLRCDREYPSCGRCLKSKTPTKCTYEDGFLWQQPSTVSPSTGTTFHTKTPTTTTTGCCDRQGPTEKDGSLSPTIHTRVAEPDSGLTGVKYALGLDFDRNHPKFSAYAPSSVDVDRGHLPPPQPAAEERKDHFLETVLGAPKTTGEPFLPNDTFQRSKQSDYSHGARAHHVDDHGHSHEFTSLSQRLDVSPRIMMRGRETRTRFNGAGILANLVVQVRTQPKFLFFQ